MCNASYGVQSIISVARLVTSAVSLIPEDSAVHINSVQQWINPHSVQEKWLVQTLFKIGNILEAWHGCSGKNKVYKVCSPIAMKSFKVSGIAVKSYS